MGLQLTETQALAGTEDRLNGSVRMWQHRGGARLGDNSDSGRWETADTGMSGMVLFI